MNKFLIVLLLALVYCNKELNLDSVLFEKFQRFIKKYNKKYESINEFLARFEVFKSNTMSVLSEKNTLYKTGITKFSDLTKQEFAKIYLNLNYDAMATINLDPYIVNGVEAAPDAYDWRNYNVVSAVKDQGSCGSCWAFAATGNLEGLYAIHKGNLRTFSEQMLVDCDTTDSGCNGGLMEYTFEWLKKNGGIMFDSDYPYKGIKSTCKSNKSKYADMTILGWKKLGDSSSTWSCVDEDEVKEFLYETGPLAIALNADPLQTYSSGILDLTSTKCPSSGINHAVLLVGYGVQNGINYWIIKNSWGKSWGESGYFRIRRGNGTCGVNCYVITAIVSFD